MDARRSGDRRLNDSLTISLDEAHTSRHVCSGRPDATRCATTTGTNKESNDYVGDASSFPAPDRRRLGRRALERLLHGTGRRAHRCAGRPEGRPDSAAATGSARCCLAGRGCVTSRRCLPSRLAGSITRCLARRIAGRRRSPGRPGRLQAVRHQRRRLHRRRRHRAGQPRSCPGHRAVPAAAQRPLRRPHRLERQDGAPAGPRHRLGGHARRQDLDVQASPGRQVPRRHAVHLAGRQGHRRAPAGRRDRLVATGELHPHQGSRHSGRRHGPHHDRSADAGPAVPDGGRLDSDHQPGRAPEVRQGPRAEPGRHRAVHVQGVDPEPARRLRGQSGLLGSEAAGAPLGLPPDP